MIKLRIREAAEFLDSQVWETPVPQVQERMELTTKELEREEVREET